MGMDRQGRRAARKLSPEEDRYSAAIPVREREDERQQRELRG
jgi:hypothetical protein